MKAQSIYRRLQELLPEVKAWGKLEVKVLDQQRDGSAGDAVEWSCGLHAVANIMHMVCTSGQPESRQGRNLTYEEQRVISHRVAAVALAKVMTEATSEIITVCD
jgi:hypothetical protein